ncbi:helix-turn-helix transcriptional regulator [Frigoribacterium sp. PhB160]|uniref:helix-turn-helix domain-containing protein n=1 Tax=Frigoribacterium sp. PhB160 TaxID=2485192 RepID=UPI000F49584B|nr:helix-turn-helix transcriptional regulator [Frigoribacterium sp. PhB160]
MGRTARAKPAALAPSPWPDVHSDDPIGEVARRFAQNLRQAVGSRSIRSVAEASGVTHTTLLSVLAGQVWPDLETIAKLERGLGVGLWPRGH